jgi:uncharacterized protein (DUF2235 family)
MAKNIILLSDGTGNSSGKLAKTNVWRLYQALDLSASGSQIAYYDDGVGTASFKPLALLGGITGWGLKRNVLDLYTFLCRHYEDGDQVYCFGFSRGAFTIRVLAGLIGNQGLVQAKTEGELRDLAKQAFRAYRACYERKLLTPLRYVRDKVLGLVPGRQTYIPLPTTRQMYNPPAGNKNEYNAHKENIPPASYYATKKTPDTTEKTADTAKKEGYEASRDKTRKVEIKFLGLWDTVAAYGLPFDELTQAWDFIFPLSFPDRNLGSIIDHACHALALDDERHSFHPELWNENEDDYKKAEEYWQRPVSERLTQVWFAGMHSNLGGGYPDDALAHVPLNWMIEQAGNNDLRFKEDERQRLREAADVNGKMYDSRQGLGGLYRYLPRSLADLTQENGKKDRVIIDTPKIHESVFTRINNRVDGYAPIGLPKHYVVYPPDEKRPFPPIQDRPEQGNPLASQENVWRIVHRKRIVYFLTVTLSILLVSLPIYSSAYSTHKWEYPFDILSPVLNFLSKVLPDMLSPWLEAFQKHLGIFSLLIILLSICLFLGSKLQGKIFDTMRRIFDYSKAVERVPGEGPNLPHPKSKLVKIIKHEIVPRLILFIVLWFIVLSIVRGGFILMDLSGRFSSPTLGTIENNPTIGQGILFDSKSILNASGIRVEEGKCYRIKLTVNGDKWHDDSIPADFNGFEKLKLILAIPLRRHLKEPWFKPIARIGNRGNDDYVLEPLNCSDSKTLISEITPRRSGELFLFVNDAVLPIGQRGQFFYNNNVGTATVEVTEIQTLEAK